MRFAMGRPCYRLVVSLAGLLLSGCASSAWWAHKPDDAKAGPPPASHGGTSLASSGSTAGHADAQAMQQVMAELQQVGALDPAAQEKLMADLRQTDPGMWPLMLEQFRAAAAYRRQRAEKETASRQETVSNRTSTGSENNRVAPSRFDSEEVVRLPEVSGSPPGRSDTAPSEPRRFAGHSSDQPPWTGHFSAQLPQSGTAVKLIPPPTKSEVQQVAYASPVTSTAAPPADPHACLLAAIRTIEVQAKASPQSEADISLQARLRMLYLLAGRREEAMQPIPAAPRAAQDYWSKQIYGLATWLDAERTPDSARRAAETKRVLDEAIARLAETAPLTVRNLAFCRSVQSYGSIEPFKKAEFQPDQEVLLYAEIENFFAESTPKGYHTSLKSSYQVFDSHGQRVAEREFPPTDEYCQNPRRDFFIGYHLYMPKRINPGRYTLQLTIEDSKSQKVGQSSIEFAVKGE